MFPLSVNDPQYWEKHYQEGTTRWDLGKAAPPFVHLLQSTVAPTPGRIAVLGSGRGYDALLFAQYGFDVTGVDFAISAITDAQALAEAAGSQAKFLQRDIFDLPGEFENYFDYVLEHTCFCAIDPQQRPAYVQVIKSVLQPQGELIGLFFTHNRPGGPPFGVTPAEIQQYFERDFEILSLLLTTNSVPERLGEEHLGRFRVLKKDVGV
ncbi:MAG: methyltransferase domain-containing protein [Scytonema sp. PMC 1069.18]|nr:methyltransferase domain-containing protein [Scytonema sp. PMC 1069.18]MEC4887148.1 methyltransferase domain-containing protein [Scytonema sp. PMC 1070.18]